MTGPLTDVRVLDLTTGIAGPVAGMLLADLGASVVRIHAHGTAQSEDLPSFHVWNRNKRLIAYEPGDQDFVGQLIGLCDVVLVGTCPGAFTYDHLLATGRARGSATWVVMPPYTLPSVPWARETESPDLVFASLGHAWSQASYSDVPVDCVYPLSSIMQGIWAAAVAVAALAGNARGTLGPRSYIVGGAHAGVLMSPTNCAVRHTDDQSHRPGGPGGPLPNYRCYRCGDGEWVFLGAFTEAFIRRALQAIGAPHILSDSRINGDAKRIRRPENFTWIVDELERIFLTRTRPEWLQIVEQADVPIAAVLNSETWLDHQQVIAMGLRHEIRNDAGKLVVMPGTFVEMSATPCSIRSAAPLNAEETTIADIWTPRGLQRHCDREQSDSLPLAGVEVLDLGTVIAGPYVGAMLGELGASVTKIERLPDGDEYRVAHRGTGVGFEVTNREQRSLALDLSCPAGLGTFLHLVKTADVVVDNYRPGVARRLGITWENLSVVNPRVTSISISTFGDRGPLGSQPGFDPIVQAISGIMRKQGGANPADSPVFLTVPINDVLAAGLGALGACASILACERSGSGQQVSVTLAAASCLLQSGQVVRVDDRSPDLDGGRDFHGPTPFSRLYQAADGWIRLDALWPTDWPLVVEAGLLKPVRILTTSAPQRRLHRASLASLLLSCCNAVAMLAFRPLRRERQPSCSTMKT